MSRPKCDNRTCPICGPWYCRLLAAFGIVLTVDIDWHLIEEGELFSKSEATMCLTEDGHKIAFTKQIKGIETR